MYRVDLTDEARRTYAEMDRPIAKKVARCLAQLQIEPRRHNNVKRLSGRLEGLFRYRVGDHRVIYSITDSQRQVVVLSIAHRSEIYE